MILNVDFINLQVRKQQIDTTRQETPYPSTTRLWNVVYFRRDLTCILGLANDLIDGGQPRVRIVLKTGFGFPLRRRSRC